MTVQEYIDSKNIKWRRRGDNAIFNCPKCGDTEQKFAISLSSGAYNCLHLNNCGIKGSFSSFQRLMGDSPTPKKKQTFISAYKKKYRKPTATIKPMIDSVIKYLDERGLTKETRERFGVGAYNAETVMLPYYRNGELINVKYRNILNKDMRVEKDAETILFGRDLITDKNVLTICEGEYDAMALWRYGIQAVSVPMGVNNLQWIDSEWEFLETFQTINLCFDTDNAGRLAALNVAARLGEWRCRIVNLPAKDANECLIKKLTVSEAFDEAERLSPESLVDPTYFESSVKNIFQQGVNLYGTPTAWRGLDEKLKGWRDGEITIWSGRNGSGKSTILNQHIIDMAEKGIKSCIYSGEMPPERYLRWAVIQHTKNDAPSPFAIENSLRWMDDKIYILNITSNVEVDTLLNVFEYAARRHNVKHFIIDSLMKVNIDMGDEYKSQKDFIERLCQFAQKLKVHVHVVAHPRKTMNDSDAPGKVDVKGSSHITDLAHNVLVLNRTSDEQKQESRGKGKLSSDMQLYVKKNREFGIEGKVQMLFNEKTKRYSDMEV